MKKIIFSIIIIALTLYSQTSNGQGCEGPGEGDGIKWFGFIQPTYEYKFLGEDFKMTKDKDQSSFYFERARFGAMGNIPYDFQYYFVMEYAPERNLGILDAYVSYTRFAPYINASIGQFKSPFSAEQLMGCHKLYTVKRSKVVDQLAGPIRDFGFMIFGGTGEKQFLGLKNKDIISYQLAIMNGEGRNIVDKNNRKSFVGHLGLNPFDFISAGTSFRYGKTPSLAGLEKDDYSTKLGFDLKLNLFGFTVLGEYISSNSEGSYTTGGGCDGTPLVVHQGSVKSNGYFFTALYKTPWNFEPVFKFETYDPNIDAASVNDIQNTMTFGFNYHFNEWTRLQVNYLYNAEESAKVEKPNDVLLVQVQAVIK
ncbi:MAG: porin [Deltaproteobacteria bacterium]